MPHNISRRRPRPAEPPPFVEGTDEKAVNYYGLRPKHRAPRRPRPAGVPPPSSTWVSLSNQTTLAPRDPSAGRVLCVAPLNPDEEEDDVAPKRPIGDAIGCSPNAVDNDTGRFPQAGCKISQEDGRRCRRRWKYQRKKYNIITVVVLSYRTWQLLLSSPSGFAKNTTVPPPAEILGWFLRICPPMPLHDV